jgi:hypothetical protein
MVEHHFLFVADGDQECHSQRRHRDQQWQLERIDHANSARRGSAVGGGADEFGRRHPRVVHRTDCGAHHRGGAATRDPGSGVERQPECSRRGETCDQHGHDDYAVRPLNVSSEADAIHAQVMHHAYSQAEQDTGAQDSQQAALARDEVQGERSGHHCGQQGGHRLRHGISHRQVHLQGQHADEVHRPDANAAKRQTRSQRVDHADAAVGLHDVLGRSQGDERAHHRDDVGERYISDVVARDGGAVHRAFMGETNWLRPRLPPCCWGGSMTPFVASRRLGNLPNAPRYLQLSRRSSPVAPAEPRAGSVGCGYGRIGCCGRRTGCGCGCAWCG